MNLVKKNGFVLILVLLLIAIFSVGAYFAVKSIFPEIYSRFSTKSDVLLEGADISFKNLFQDIANTFSKNFDPSKTSLSYSQDGELYWPTEDGFLITVDSSSKLNIKNTCEVEIARSDFAQRANSFIDALNKDFNKSDFYRFSSTALTSTDEPMWKVSGYKNAKTGQFCLVMFDFMCGGNSDEPMHQDGSIVCNSGVNFEKAKSEQFKMLQGLGLKKSVVRVAGNYGQYYRLFSSWIFGPGFALVAKKTDDDWTKLAEGQDYIKCEIANKYQIPHQLGDIVEKCYDPNSGVLVPNAN